MGKNFDATGGFGPWMVTADEVPPGGKGLKIESRLNGKVMQSDNTNNMMFPVAETLADISQGMTLGAGRHHRHRHAVGRRLRAQAAGVDERTATSARSRSKASASCAIRSRRKDLTERIAAGRPPSGLFLRIDGGQIGMAAS